MSSDNDRIQVTILDMNGKVTRKEWRDAEEISKFIPKYSSEHRGSLPVKEYQVTLRIANTLVQIFIPAISEEEAAEIASTTGLQVWPDLYTKVESVKLAGT